MTTPSPIAINIASLDARLQPRQLPTDLRAILAPIAADMANTDRTIHEWLKSEVALINEIGHYLVSAGGKRLRPALVLMCARALGAEGMKPALLAAIIEFIHTATLLHDDVVDQSDRRRGRKTANAVWGNAGAVLSGDFLYSRSFQMMIAAESPAVMKVMADATNAIAEGEVLQLMNVGDPEVNESKYLRVIELKTARLFEAAAKLGAIAADASDEQILAMGRYGHSLGICYQLVDDLLDYLADPETSGKNLGTDLAEGKPTLPLIRATMRANDADSNLIREAICHGQLDQMENVLRIVESTDAIPYTRALAAGYRDAAIAALDVLPESSFKLSLQNLADFAFQRNH